MVPFLCLLSSRKLATERRSFPSRSGSLEEVVLRATFFPCPLLVLFYSFLNEGGGESSRRHLEEGRWLQKKNAHRERKQMAAVSPPQISFRSWHSLVELVSRRCGDTKTRTGTKRKETQWLWFVFPFPEDWRRPSGNFAANGGRRPGQSAQISQCF